MTQPSRTMLLRQFLVDVYAPRQRLSQGAVYQYGFAMKALDAWHGDPVRLDQLTGEMAAGWMAHMLSKPIAHSTVKNRRRHLLTLWLAAYRGGLTENAPDVPPLSVGACPPPIQREGEQPAITPTMLLKEFVAHYVRKRALSVACHYQYAVTATSLDRWSGEPVRLKDLNDGLFNDWLQHIQANDTAPATVRCRRTHALALWRDAHRAGLAQQAPRDVRPARCPWVPPTAWAHAEVSKLLSAAERLAGFIPSRRWVRANQGEVRRSVFWALLIRVAWDTALRLSDIRSLTPGQVDSDGTIQLVQGKTQRWHGARLNQETIEALSAHATPGQPRLFRWPYSDELFRREFQEIRRLAEIPPGSFKKLRRSSATDVEMRFPGCGAAHLGHAAAHDIARNHYIDPRLTLGGRPLPTPLRISQQQETGGPT